MLNNKGYIGFFATTFIILAIGIGFIFYAVPINMNIVKLNTSVNFRWKSVEIIHQKRIDLMSKFLATIKQEESSYDKGAFDKFAENIEKTSSIQIDPSNISDEKFQKFQKSLSELNSSFDKLVNSFEKYPELKNNKYLITLQGQIKDTEKLITKQKDLFNKDVTNYNKYIQGSYQHIIAEFRNFRIKPLFK